MRCDLCGAVTEKVFRMMPLCPKCMEKVKENRKQRREKEGKG